MSKQVIITGRTVEEAMEQAKKEYGGSEWELSYEILEMPKRGFFGIGAAPAKLRVTISRALEEVNLSDLVSEIRNMKITTDPDGAVEERPNRNSRYDNRDNRSDNRDNRNRRDNRNTRDSGGYRSDNRDNRSNRYENGSSRPNANSRNNNRYNNAENRTDSRNAQAAPAAKPEMKPAAPVTQSEKIEQPVKPQTQSTAKPAAQPVVAPVAQPAPVKPEAKPVEQGNALPGNELPGNELPAALRPPKSRPQQNKTNRKPKNAPNSNPKTVENRPQEEKKKDLMAAILGIGAAAQPQTQTQAQHEQVAPAAQTQSGQPPVAPVEKISVNVSVDVSVDGSAIVSNTDARSADGHLGFVPQREMEYALSFLRTLLADLDMTAQANAADAPEGVEVPDGFAYAKIDITGRDTAILIGHHGDTMDSLQYLLNLSALRHSTADKKDYVKIVLDVEGYRVKREETLRALARRMAAKAVRYKRNMVLDPMNPYERRIIHSELQGVENISTHSVGSDENRKIVIFYEGADRVRDNRRRNDRPQRRPQQAAQQQTRSEAQLDATETKSPAAAEAKTTTTTYHHPERRREKPVRAKSIDEIKIDLSEASSATFGSLNTEISADEGYEKDPDPIETMETNSDEENLREY